MKKIAFTTFYILTLCLGIFGQTQNNSNCPTISVTGPPAALADGENAAFTVNISGFDANILEYIWSVSKGKIIEGQGTNTVIVGEIPPDSITVATVEINGLPKGCPNSVSESTIPICLPDSIAIDEIAISSTPINQERLDAWVTEFENDPSAKAYIIIYSDKRLSPAEIKKKETYIKKYFLDKNIAADRLTIVNDRSEDDNAGNIIRLFKVPVGAKPPIP